MVSSLDKANGKAAVHLVSTFYAHNRLALDQVKVGTKSNEITAIPELLKRLTLSGSLVTLDAMGCQKKITSNIREAGADYVLSLKGNQQRRLRMTGHARPEYASIVECSLVASAIPHH